MKPHESRLQVIIVAPVSLAERAALAASLLPVV